VAVGVEIRQHEIRGARRVLVEICARGVNPISEHGQSALGTDRRFEDAAEQGLGFGFIVDAASAAPLRVGQQQAEGHVRVAVEGAVIVVN